jgi:hypothetical protein
MVGRQRQQQGARIILGRIERRERQGCGRVAGRRLQDDPAGARSDLAQVLPDQEAVALAPDDDRRPEARPGDPSQARLKQALGGRKSQKLLGKFSSRQRSEAHAAAAAEDHGTEGEIAEHPVPDEASPGGPGVCLRDGGRRGKAAPPRAGRCTPTRRPKRRRA